MENEIIIYHLFVNFVLVQRYMMKTYKDIKIMILPIYIYIFFFAYLWKSVSSRLFMTLCFINCLEDA